MRGPNNILSFVVSTPAVSVVMPVDRAQAGLAGAVECVLKQTAPTLELVLVVAGPDAQGRSAAAKLARADARVRVAVCNDPAMGAMLAMGLEQSKHELVALMDGDDLCHVERLALQAQHMNAHGGVAALGCAWEVIDGDGAVLWTQRPPTAPRELRWRMLLGGVLAPGTLMLRKAAARAVGGFNPRCGRGAEHELLLRMVRSLDVACLPDVLHQQRLRGAGDAARAAREQADVCSRAMLEAWRALSERTPAPSGAPDPVLAAARAVLARDVRPGVPDGVEQLEAMLSKQPSREALLAWLWAQCARPTGERRALEVGRRARVRELGAALRAAGTRRVYLWGLSELARSIVQSESDLGVAIAALIDDGGDATRFGREVHRPDTLLPGELAIVCADEGEDEAWASTLPHRARGVRVLRFYADDDEVGQVLGVTIKGLPVAKPGAAPAR